MKWHVGGAILLLVLSTPWPARAAPPAGGTLDPAKAAEAAAAAKARAEAFNKRRWSIQGQLRSGKPDQIDKAFDDIHAWYGEFAKDAEQAFFLLRMDFLKHRDRAAEIKLLIDSSMSVRKRNKHSPGYLYALRACCDFELHDSPIAINDLDEGFVDEKEWTGVEAVNMLPIVLMPAKRYAELADAMTKLIVACPEYPSVVEGGLKQRIAVYNAQKEYDKALSDAKSLFNVSTMEHTADALTILDRQMTLAKLDDRSVVEQCRAEQVEGARVPAAVAGSMRQSSKYQPGTGRPSWPACRRPGPASTACRS